MDGRKRISMKKYKVVLAIFEDGTSSADVIDLVNVDDEEDRLMADPDSFYVDDIITEKDFVMKNVTIVNEQYCGSAPMAFKKK